MGFDESPHTAPTAAAPPCTAGGGATAALAPASSWGLQPWDAPTRSCTEPSQAHAHPSRALLGLTSLSNGAAPLPDRHGWGFDPRLGV